MSFLAFAFLIPSALFAYLTNLAMEKADNVLLEVIPFVICCALFLVGVVTPIAEFDSNRKANFYNARFGTHYTANDFFWNGEEIEKMLIGEKVRVEH